MHGVNMHSVGLIEGFASLSSDVVSQVWNARMSAGLRQGKTHMKQTHTQCKKK